MATRWVSTVPCLGVRIMLVVKALSVLCCTFSEVCQGCLQFNYYSRNFNLTLINIRYIVNLVDCEPCSQTLTHPR